MSETGTSSLPAPKATVRTAAARAKKAAGATPARDALQTRARILKAAIAEFSAKGYSGARTEQIAKRAKSNIRMLYHYFGGKDDLYVRVLEEVLSQLRRAELKLDFSNVEPDEGVLRLYDFIDRHFGERSELRRLLAFENMNAARHLRRSSLIPTMSSPVIRHLRDLLERGSQSGDFKAGLDPLHLYTAMVSLAYYSRAHAHTLSQIFDTDLLDKGWQDAHREQSRLMILGYLKR